MKDNTTHGSLIVWILIILQFLLGLGAAISGGLLIPGTDGHLIEHFPVQADS